MAKKKKHKTEENIQTITKESKANPKIIISLILCTILILAFSIRLLWIFNINPSIYPAGVGTGGNNNLGWDGVRYDWVAINLLNNNEYGYSPGHADAWRPPGYPFFLFTIYSIFGHNYFTVRIIQAILNTAICAFLFFLTRRLTKSNPIGLVAAFLYAIYSYAIIFTSIFYSEPLASFFTITALYLFILSEEKQNIAFLSLFSLAAIVFWYAVLIRPANILFWACIALWFLIRNKEQIQKVVAAGIIVIAGFCLIVMPWTIRNYKIYNKPVLFSTNGGFNFFMANHPQSKGYFIPESIRYSSLQKEEIKGLNPVELDKKLYKYGLEHIKEHPGRFIKLIVIKQKLLWTYKENKGLLFTKINNIWIPLITFNFLALFSLIGVFFCWKNLNRIFLILGYIFIHAAIISLIYYYHGPRTRIELIPFLCITASIGIVKFVDMIIKIIKY